MRGIVRPSAARTDRGTAAAALLAGVALALTTAACSPEPVAQRPPQPGDAAVARINGEVVWASDVKREAVAEGLIGPGDPLDQTSDLFRQVLDEVIDTKVLAAEAVKRKLDKDPAAQRRLAAARDRALEDLLVDNVVGQALSPEAEAALYQEFLRNQTPAEEIHLRQIVLASQAEAEQVKKLIAEGSAFDALAMERSRDDATRFKGGDLGTTTTDTLPEALATAVKGAKAGQVVGPVRLDQGWAVLKVDARGPEPAPTFESARPQIIRFLTYDRVKDLVLKLRSQAKIATLIAPPPDVPGAPTEPASAPPPASGAPAPAANTAMTKATP
ncbi:MAG: peptidylprolyl isomerase [Caulobacteraceae bacterium]|nr:peptidylprolyl isomerase [Caulobacteraceae bacterium]